MKNPFLPVWLLAVSLLLPALHGEGEKETCPLACKPTAVQPATTGQLGAGAGAPTGRTGSRPAFSAAPDPAVAPTPTPRATAPRPIRRTLPAHLFM